MSNLIFLSQFLSSPKDWTSSLAGVQGPLPQNCHICDHHWISTSNLRDQQKIPNHVDYFMLKSLVNLQLTKAIRRISVCLADWSTLILVHLVWPREEQSRKWRIRKCTADARILHLKVNEKFAECWPLGDRGVIHLVPGWTNYFRPEKLIVQRLSIMCTVTLALNIPVG